MDEGGVVRAAAKLNRVQSNVTTRIRQLEERLGRGCSAAKGRSHSLSPDGHTLLPYADRLLRLADEAVSEMRTGKPQGHVPAGLAREHGRHPPGAHPVALHSSIPTWWWNSRPEPPAR